MRTSNTPAAPLPLLLPLAPGLTGTRAANGPAASARSVGADANDLVARVVGHVASVVDLGSVCIRVELDPVGRVLRGNDRAMAFALGGVLSRVVRSLDHRDGASSSGTVRVETHAASDRVRIVITTDEIPPLELVRAITGTDSPCAAPSDPAVVDCRRLIENEGGRIEIVSDAGSIGLEIELPAIPTPAPHVLAHLPQVRGAAGASNHRSHAA